MNDNAFSTRDFYSACVLRVAGLPLTTVNKLSSGMSNFVFEDRDSRATSIINHFWNRNLKVDARLFVESINELKTRLYTN